MSNANGSQRVRSGGYVPGHRAGRFGRGASFA
jgi:hypothetical protein